MGASKALQGEGTLHKAEQATHKRALAERTADIERLFLDPHHRLPPGNRPILAVIAFTIAVERHDKMENA